MNKAKGFILVMTLIISTLISLLVVTSMRHILVYYKASTKQKEMHHSFYQLEEVALELARSSSGKEACILPFDDANKAMEQLVRGKGCFLKKEVISYQYVIEELGEFPCLKVYQKGQKIGTHHRRVTVVHLDEGSPLSLVQLRWISGGGAESHCNTTTERIIHLGLSSWRYFSLIVK